MKLLRSLGILPFFGLAVLVGAGQSVLAPRVAAAEPQLAILDTDIGDDIDDVFALALLLRSPEVNLLGVTTAYGDTELRAQLLDRYLGAIERFNIPVATGVATAQSNVFSQAAYARQKSRTEWTKVLHQGPEGSTAIAVGGNHHQDGVELLLDQIRLHPGQITLIAIGPLNNIQAAIEKDLATFRKLKRVVMMGGSIYRGYDGQQGERRAPDAEWNISRDPAGLRALLASGVPVYMMPLDSTQIHLDTKERELIFAHGSPLTDQLTLLYHQWLANKGDASPTPTLFDPVAVAYAVHPELCPMTPLRLNVDEKGMTIPIAGEPNAQVCLQSDEKGFLDLLLSRLTEKP
jgi:inosine-uridine nucleoside N-ribohydrolase